MLTEDLTPEEQRIAASLREIKSRLLRVETAVFDGRPEPDLLTRLGQALGISPDKAGATTGESSAVTDAPSPSTFVQRLFALWCPRSIASMVSGNPEDDVTLAKLVTWSNATRDLLLQLGMIHNSDGSYTFSPEVTP